MSAKAISRHAPSEYGTDVRGRLEQGGKVRAIDYLNAQEVMRRARDEAEALLKSVDAIVIPTSPIGAPPMGSDPIRIGDAESRYAPHWWTGIVSETLPDCRPFPCLAELREMACLLPCNS